MTDAEVDLVIWQPDQRPTVFDADGLGDNDTATSFLAKNIDVWSANSTATLADQRAEVDKITDHCLGCHSDQNNDTEPFGDCKTPRQYAWDRGSVGSRYSETGTASLGKYTSTNSAQKIITKAFSAHGNAIAGSGGWDPATGVDETIPNTRAGAYNIQCFDCHSSHGSMVEGTTSSYTTFNGTRNGANLKETQAGKGGYPMNYMATANPDPNTVNPYQAGAGQCFDCHETADANTQISPVSKTPWGYSETFGATEPVIGYKDNPRFKGNYAAASRYGYRASKETLGGHFRASHTNPDSPNYDMSGASDITAMGTIDGLCAPCHDPHGISTSLAANKAYAVPLLKGTWLSSPYKEDGPPLMDDGLSGSNGFNNGSNTWNSSTKPYPMKVDPQPTGVWRTDRNTFNQGDLSLKVNHPDTYGRVSEEAETFAGLCLRCHPKETLTTETSVETTEAIPWATSDRIHRTVKGWGWTEGDDPREHSFTCSKCHQPHASGLPRLMQTNCLNYPHRGQQEVGGTPEVNATWSKKNLAGRYPYGWWDNGVFESYSTGVCHGADTANGSANWPDNQGWNTVTPWQGGN